jgi:dGTPase
MNHDIDDAERAGIMTTEDIPFHLRAELGVTHGERIDFMVQSIIRQSMGKNEIAMEADVAALAEELHSFLYEAVYKNPIAKGEEGKAEALLENLYYYYMGHPDQLPYEARITAEEEGVARGVCDHLAGMTDRYAINTYKRLFLPEVWNRGL